MKHSIIYHGFHYKYLQPLSHICQFFISGIQLRSVMITKGGQCVLGQKWVGKGMYVSIHI